MRTGGGLGDIEWSEFVGPKPWLKDEQSDE